MYIKHKNKTILFRKYFPKKVKVYYKSKKKNNTISVKTSIKILDTKEKQIWYKDLSSLTITFYLNIFKINWFRHI